MKYVMAIVWSFLISCAISYVLSQMAMDPFSLTQTFILTAIFSIFIILLNVAVLNDTEQEN